MVAVHASIPSLSRHHLQPSTPPDLICSLLPAAWPQDTLAWLEEELGEQLEGGQAPSVLLMQLKDEVRLAMVHRDYSTALKLARQIMGTASSELPQGGGAGALPPLMKHAAQQVSSLLHCMWFAGACGSKPAIGCGTMHTGCCEGLQ